MAFNKNALVEEIKQTLAQQAQLPEPNYSPIWVNNQTRLNASNFNDKMYKTISGYTKTLANNAYNTSADSIEKVINYNAGWRPTNDDSEVTATSELHNYSIDNEGNVNNTVNGAYQSVFGNGNILTDQEGQFVTGTFAKTTVEQGKNPLLFVIGNGTDKNNTSNAFSISTKGEMNIKDIIADEANITELVSDKITSKNLTSANGDIQNFTNETLTSVTGIITNLTSNSITASVSMSTPVITIENTPTNNKHGTNKKYVDDSITTEKNRAVGVENKLRTDLDNEISRAKSEEDSIRAIASSAFHFKGTKPSYDDLPKTGNTQGDVWQVGDKEYAWNGTAWVELGFNIDLSPYITTVDAETKIATAKSEAISTANTYTDTQVAKKQNTLVSGSNIKALKDDKTSAQTLLGSGNISFKTINGNSLFGIGNIEIQGGGSSITVDDTLSLTSTNPVQNKVITNALNDKQEFIGRVNATDMLLTLTTINRITNVHNISSGDTGLLTVGDSDNELLDLRGIDVTVTTGNYNMSYDNTKEAIVWTFK